MGPTESRSNSGKAEIGAPTFVLCDIIKIWMQAFVGSAPKLYASSLKLYASSLKLYASCKKTPLYMQVVYTSSQHRASSPNGPKLHASNPNSTGVWLPIGLKVGIGNEAVGNKYGMKELNCLASEPTRPEEEGSGYVHSSCPDGSGMQLCVGNSEQLHARMITVDKEIQRSLLTQ